jgi:hypothetical protein
MFYRKQVNISQYPCHVSHQKYFYHNIETIMAMRVSCCGWHLTFTCIPYITHIFDLSAILLDITERLIIRYIR